MVALNEGDEVKVSTDEWAAYGVIAALTQDEVYTELEADRELYMTIHATEVISGDIEPDTWQTCKIGSIVEHEGENMTIDLEDKFED